MLYHKTASITMLYVSVRRRGREQNTIIHAAINTILQDLETKLAHKYLKGEGKRLNSWKLLCYYSARLACKGTHLNGILMDFWVDPLRYYTISGFF